MRSNRTNYSNQLYSDYMMLLDKNEKLEASNKKLKKIESLYKNEVKYCEKLGKALDEKDKVISEKDKEIEALKREILKLKGIAGLDSNNSNIPTSQTPIKKVKRIPNSRTSTGKKKGGQPGHSKTILEAFDDDEITEYEEHTLNECPECGGELERLDDEVTKDETDYEVVVVKRRHRYPMYRCKTCGKTFHDNIAPNLKEGNQYGSGVKALALLLMNTGNTSINKVRRMIYGLSRMYINPSEGYIVKQQKIAAKLLDAFIEDLRTHIIKLNLVYWDDTVIYIRKKRACLRFYGNERLALYKAHLTKGCEGLDEDNVLQRLSANTTVMHDHNKVNYNEKYSFNNVECNAHLLRDLEFVAENLPTHTWAKALKEEIITVKKQRDELIAQHTSAFPDEYTAKFFTKFDLLMLEAAAENNSEPANYYTDKERQTINRLLDYKDNYFAWVVNFEYPFTNNLSERAMRSAKSKMKISGQFQSETYARHYAAIKSYIETCYRNGINEYGALRRLCDGHPYTVDEILAND